MRKVFTHIDLGWAPGMLSHHIEHAIHIADMTNCKVSFKFNGVAVNVTKHSSLSYVHEGVIHSMQSEGKFAVFGEGW